MNFCKRLHEFGGWRLIRAYYQMGVLDVAIKNVIHSILQRKSPIYGYHQLTKKIDPILIQKYTNVPEIYIQPLPKCVPNQHRVWQCWLQGMDQRPELVRQCMESQRKSLSECEFEEITEENYQNWVTLPPYIIEKRKKNYIPDALFSDILRLELLVRYGGLWLDGTVYASLFSSEEYHKKKVDQILRSEIFVMQYIHNDKVVGLANWMIAAKAGNPMLKRVLERIYAYWRDFDSVVQYYIFHIFLGMAMNDFPELANSMPKGNAYPSLRLANTKQPISPEEWKQITYNTCFHKLNWRKA